MGKLPSKLAKKVAGKVAAKVKVLKKPVVKAKSAAQTVDKPIPKEIAKAVAKAVVKTVAKAMVKPKAKTGAKTDAKARAKPAAQSLVKLATPVVQSPADALFSKGRQRVLAVLFSAPERSFYTTEIIALAQAGSGSVQRELATLAQANLLVMTQKLSKKYYQANTESPVFYELRALVQRLNGESIQG